jgi:AbrB family looped-hinge helix DNA binding protein
MSKDIIEGKETMPTSTLTSKGQITIPKELRDQLHLKKGSRLEFLVEASGRVVLQPLNSDFRAIRGMIRSKRKRPVSIKEMNQAIASAYSGT